MFISVYITTSPVMHANLKKQMHNFKVIKNNKQITITKVTITIILIQYRSL